jgi:hypothetical protein
MALPVMKHGPHAMPTELSQYSLLENHRINNNKHNWNILTFKDTLDQERD